LRNGLLDRPAAGDGGLLRSQSGQLRVGEPLAGRGSAGRGTPEASAGVASACILSARRATWFSQATIPKNP
jgi:hypothetical protein